MKSLKILTIYEEDQNYGEYGTDRMREALGKTKCSAVNFAQVSELTNLEEIRILGCGLKSEDVSILANLQKLSLVNLNKNSIDDKSELKKFEDLDELYLYDQEISVIIDNREYVLPEIFTNLSKYAVTYNTGTYEPKLEIEGGTLSQDGKKAIFSNTAKSGDKITVKIGGNGSCLVSRSEIVITYKPDTYEYVEGKDATYTIGKDKGLTFRIDAKYELFKNGGKVYVDNKEVASKYITSKEGSTIITLAEEFVKTLKAGSHEIKVVFSNAVESKAGFTVVAQQTETKTETKTETTTNVATETKTETTTTATTTEKPADYKANPDTGRIVLSYTDLSVVNAINF